MPIVQSQIAGRVTKVWDDPDAYVSLYKGRWKGLANSTLDPTAASVTIDGQSWALTGNVAYDPSALAIVNGTGLRATMTAASSTFDISSASMFQACIPITTWFSAYDQTSEVVIQAILSGVGNQNTEIHGIGFGATSSTFYGGFGGLGVSSGSYVSIAHRQQSTAVTDSGVARAGTYDCIRVAKRGYNYIVTTGISVNGDFPIEWVTQTQPSFAQNQQPSGAALAISHVYLYAATGNVNGNFVPVWDLFEVLTPRQQQPR